MRKKLAAIGRGCVADERKEIASGTEFEITYSLIHQNISKLQIMLTPLSFKAEKKARKEKRR